ncbi:translation initiation factor Sui1 [Rubripirellula tenax]|uniref:Translation initiation factor Sui1 n=1 Tax=Rubripirellula tenax TaxID=2528015 RepID=A0A5C6FFV2_9BACT|nr:translation initiation factor [Rubripirellula tenax]TWU60401.1 translation initiation factor Sui1 [Rubripirellula tenax]
MTRLFAGTAFDIPPECDLCGKVESDCQCTDKQKADAAAAAQVKADRLLPGEQTAVVRVEKRKGGRQVTVVTGLAAKANDLSALLAALQSSCGSGGTVKAKEDLAELQGDHAAEVRKSLAEMGFRVTAK